MVLPLFDDNSDRRIIPVVNYTLLGLNIIVFLLFQQLGANQDFTYAFSAVPEEIVQGVDKETPKEVVVDSFTGKHFERPGLRSTGLPYPIAPYITLLTSIFMHGSIAHLLGNMLFLWIFGDNLEDRLGHIRYLIFYLICGFLASFAHIACTYLFGMNPMVPSLGASGAISGVLGGYILLFPHRRVTVLLFRFITTVPAFVAIGMWFVFQLIAGMGAFGSGSSGGVAYGAHIGGFLAGLALIKIFSQGIPSTSNGQLRQRFFPRNMPWKY